MFFTIFVQPIKLLKHREGGAIQLNEQLPFHFGFSLKCFREFISSFCFSFICSLQFLFVLPSQRKRIDFEMQCQIFELNVVVVHRKACKWIYQKWNRNIPFGRTSKKNQNIFTYTQTHKIRFKWSHSLKFACF